MSSTGVKTLLSDKHLDIAYIAVSNTPIGSDGRPFDISSIDITLTGPISPKSIRYDASTRDIAWSLINKDIDALRAQIKSDIEGFVATREEQERLRNRN